MWTRLVAGAAAHDINNLAQGLFNLLSLASTPTASREALDRYAALARDGIKDLRRLGVDLRALANAGGADETQRLDLLAVEAARAVDTTRDRTIDLGGLEANAGALVVGSGPALRLAIQAVVRYSVAASAPGGVVSVGLALDATTVSVVVVAPSAPAPRVDGDAELGTLLAGVERDFGGDAGLVMAGAAAHLSGGRISAGAAPGGGLRFKLSFPRAEERQQDEGSRDAGTS